MHKRVWHLHGHCHGNIDNLNKETSRLDVGLDAESKKYSPLSYYEVSNILKKRNVKLIDHHGKDNS